MNASFGGMIILCFDDYNSGLFASCLLAFQATAFIYFLLELCEERKWSADLFVWSVVMRPNIIAKVCEVELEDVSINILLFRFVFLEACLS